ncbi:MAG: hypothetical protein L0027_14005 [Candidatus Rokubacteria bacterium]|nr:hypothetical protein [Candidatus Rokubacteria bacterium]
MLAEPAVGADTSGAGKAQARFHEVREAVMTLHGILAGILSGSVVWLILIAVFLFLR